MLESRGTPTFIIEPEKEALVKELLIFLILLFKLFLDFSKTDHFLYFSQDQGDKGAN